MQLCRRLTIMRIAGSSQLTFKLLVASGRNRTSRGRDSHSWSKDTGHPRWFTRYWLYHVRHASVANLQISVPVQPRERDSEALHIQSLPTEFLSFRLIVL